MVGAAGYEETLPGEIRLLLIVSHLFYIPYFLGDFSVPRPHCCRLPRIPQFQVCVMLIVAQLVDYHLYFSIQRTEKCSIAIC